MSIWSSLELPSGWEPRCANENDCDEYGDLNPRDHIVDVAIAFEQIRLCVWPADDPNGNRPDGTFLNVLLLSDDARALRDLLDMALNAQP